MGAQSALPCGIAPSLLSADFNHLAQAVQMVNESEAAYLHLDIMDGLFVPNISFGFPVIEAVQKVSQKPLDAHLMIVDPDRYLERFAALHIAVLTVHWEACTHLVRTLQTVRQLGMKAGVSLNPHTPIESLSDVLPWADLVLIMSVNPGFGGQRFLPRTLSRVERLRTLIEKEGVTTRIQVDGGVNRENAPSLFEAGADILVAGSAVFSADSPREMIAQLAQCRKAL